MSNHSQEFEPQGPKKVGTHTMVKEIKRKKSPKTPDKHVSRRLRRDLEGKRYYLILEEGPSPQLGTLTRSM